MRSPPVLQQSDDEQHYAEAQQAQRQGRDLISSHLDNHAAHNPGRSSDYVTWISTLHPENADVTIDSRFFIPGNPWWSVYEQNKHELPSATAVQVPTGGDGSPGSSPPSTSAPVPMPHFCMTCNPVTLFIGVLVAFFAILGVLIAEGFALMAYFFAVIFYWMARPCNPPSGFTAIFYNFCMFLYSLIASIDSLCLLISSLVSECVAITAWCSIVCFGGILMANHWHQYIRRMCHVMRSAFRSHFTHPPRHFVVCCVPKQTAGITVERVHGLEDPEIGRDNVHPTTTHKVAPQAVHVEHHGHNHPQAAARVDDSPSVVVVDQVDVVVEEIQAQPSSK